MDLTEKAIIGSSLYSLRMRGAEVLLGLLKRTWEQSKKLQMNPNSKSYKGAQLKERRCCSNHILTLSPPHTLTSLCVYESPLSDSLSIFPLVHRQRKHTEDELSRCSYLLGWSGLSRLRKRKKVDLSTVYFSVKTRIRYNCTKVIALSPRLESVSILEKLPLL